MVIFFLGYLRLLLFKAASILCWLSLTALSGRPTGRGILRNPGIVDEMKGNAPAGKKTLKLFHDEILESYTEAFSGDRPVLFKMKELWVHMLPLLDPEERYTKKIRKAEKISEYKRIVAPLFE